MNMIDTRKLRILLAQITAEDISRHARLLEKLKTTSGHSIRLVQTDPDQQFHLKEFNCFEYALNLVYSVEYAGICDFEEGMFRPIGANDEFAIYLLDNKIISEIPESKAASSDLLMYFKDGKPTHAGKLNRSMVISKWGKGLLLEHEVFEVPAVYGENVRYFRSLCLDDCEDAFVAYAKTKGRIFEEE